MSSYKIGETSYDTYSSKNQRIVEDLVGREVYCCMTLEMEYMLSRVDEHDRDNPFDEDDLALIYVPYCSKCDSSYLEIKTVGELADDEFERENFPEENRLSYLCPACGDWYETVQEARECCGEDSEVYKCCDCGAIYSNDYVDYRREEIYEWWAVSRWFGEKLREQGCVVIEAWGKSYWGRCATGQSITLDGCVINIAKNMGILEGMEHDWSRWQ